MEHIRSAPVQIRDYFWLKNVTHAGFKIKGFITNLCLSPSTHYTDPPFGTMASQQVSFFAIFGRPRRVSQQIRENKGFTRMRRTV